ncbi:unnamed protein product [Bursaphelenchus xylophilus]|uniref:(pine wood nematode) hypothetical protein n=1 Tax=Bursaphelenchus xylophilus TaxID=6326 RepID=A0A1I7RUV7_BURXY|nr:unnamed protein product [Bursaphelenchus xylophilus]CAG9105389.1 unnamed protein product [Bursaphelenchus xylophilus]
MNLTVNHQIADSFVGLDFGLNSKSIHQLISASILIVGISVIITISFFIFRLYMLYCRNYRNTVAYHLPSHQVSSRSRRGKADTDSQRPLYSFKNVFSDSEENIMHV